MSDRKIISFLRFTGKGAVEKVEWFKRDDGTKYATKTPFKAGRIDIQLMHQSQHQEITIQ